jgi:hypothetical protein
MMRILHPVNSPDLSPCDFRFFGYTKNNWKTNKSRPIATWKTNWHTPGSM